MERDSTNHDRDGLSPRSGSAKFTRMAPNRETLVSSRPPLLARTRGRRCIRCVSTISEVRECAVTANSRERSLRRGHCPKGVRQFLDDESTKHIRTAADLVRFKRALK